MEDVLEEILGEEEEEEEAKPKPKKVEKPEEEAKEEKKEEKAEVPTIKVPEPITEPEAKEVYLIYGEKGVGKTLQGLSFSGDILALSFDRKTAIIKEKIYDGDDRISIYDIQETMDYTDKEKWPKSSEETFHRLMSIMDDWEEKEPDWVLIDGALQLQEMAEQVMRYRHDLGPFDGVSNLNIWKERKMIIRQVHKRAYDIAKRGVIFTTYTDKEEIVRDGELVAKKDVPKWIDILIFETDYVLKAEYDGLEKAHKIIVDTSKDDSKLKTGKTYDVSDFKTIWEVR